MDVFKKTCQKANISNCNLSIFYGTEQCYACQNKTYPSPDLSSCLPFPSPATGKFAACELMSVDGDKKPNCASCSSGYTVYNGFCVSTPEEFTGCLTFDKDDKECVACNVFNGWYNMTKDSQKCTKA